MRIRDGLPEDAGAIGRVQAITWRATYRGLMPDRVLDELTEEGNAARWGEIMTSRRPRTVVLVAEEGELGVVGFATAGPNRNEEVDFEAELYAIYVLPEHQGRGAGRLLLREVAERLRALGLTDVMLRVLAANGRARRFYESLSAEPLGSVSHDVDGEPLETVGYGWRDLDPLVAASAAPRP